MKKIMLVISLFILFLPSICNGEEVGESSTESSFDSSTDLTSRYSRKQILNGKTTNSEKKKGEIYLVFPFANSPYQSFSQFVLNGPTTVYSGFIETIYYREKIKIRDMYYENNPVKTDKVGIYSTDLCFTSEEGVIYHYKNVPYLVSSNQPTIFFSEVNFDKKIIRFLVKLKCQHQKIHIKSNFFIPIMMNIITKKLQPIKRVHLLLS